MGSRMKSLPQYPNSRRAKTRKSDQLHRCSMHRDPIRREDTTDVQRQATSMYLATLTKASSSVGRVSEDLQGR